MAPAKSPCFTRIPSNFSKVWARKTRTTAARRHASTTPSPIKHHPNPKKGAEFRDGGEISFGTEEKLGEFFLRPETNFSSVPKLCPFFRVWVVLYRAWCC